MTSAGRNSLFLLGALPLGAILTRAMLALPAAGRGSSKYADLLVGAVVPERHATDAVTAINFDYRGIDTLGEEFILFSAVMGVVLVLRKSADERCAEDSRDQTPRRRAPRTSDAVRVLGLALVGITVTFGLYIITHGQLTPGGGFQGGVIVATAWIVLYLAGDARTFQRLTPPDLIEAIEAAAAGVYVLVGAASLLFGLAFLGNFLPLGPQGSVRSAGTIALLSIAVGVEVAAGFILLIHTFVQEALAARADE